MFDKDSSKQKFEITFDEFSTNSFFSSSKETRIRKRKKKEKKRTQSLKWRWRRRGHLLNSGSPRSEHEGRRTNERNYVRGILTGAACESEQRGEEVVCRPGARPAFAELTSTSSSPSPGLLLPILFSLLSFVSFLRLPPSRPVSLHPPLHLPNLSRLSSSPLSSLIRAIGH